MIVKCEHFKLVGSFFFFKNAEVSSRPLDPLRAILSHSSAQITSFFVTSSPTSDEGYGSKWPYWIFFTQELEDTSSSFQTQCLQIFLSFEAIRDGNGL
jgi:hypothetical protein